MTTTATMMDREIKTKRWSGVVTMRAIVKVRAGQDN